MTIEELRIIVADVKLKETELLQACQNLDQFICEIESLIAAENPLSGAINVDQLVAIYAPIYIEKLTRIETAADALGTDPFH